jgi:hypothetical protein
VVPTGPITILDPAGKDVVPGRARTSKANGVEAAITHLGLRSHHPGQLQVLSRQQGKIVDPLEPHIDKTRVDWLQVEGTRPFDAVGAIETLPSVIVPRLNRGRGREIGRELNRLPIGEGAVLDIRDIRVLPTDGVNIAQDPIVDGLIRDESATGTKRQELEVQVLPGGCGYGIRRCQGLAFGRTRCTRRGERACFGDRAPGLRHTACGDRAPGLRHTAGGGRSTCSGHACAGHESAAVSRRIALHRCDAAKPLTCMRRRRTPSATASIRPCSFSSPTSTRRQREQDKLDCQAIGSTAHAAIQLAKKSTRVNVAQPGVDSVPKEQIRSHPNAVPSILSTMLARSILWAFRGATVLGCPMAFALAVGCKDSGCARDTDCKGARICESGKCVDARSTSVLPSASAQPLPSASSELSASATLPAPTAAPCAECQTQEDFDKAYVRRLKCCPVTACVEDADCEGGRVCCRIPNGQLCTDAARCTAPNRVRTHEAAPVDNRPPLGAPRSLEERIENAERRAISAVSAGDLLAAERAVRPLLSDAQAQGDFTPLLLRYDLALLRWAARDLAGSLGEMDASRAYLTRSNITGHAAVFQGLNVLWLRAFFLLESAAEAPASSRPSAMARAEAARKEHEAAAGSLGKQPKADLLAALFFVRSGNLAGATTRTQSFANLEPDPLELFVMTLVYRGIGNTAEAARSHRRIQKAEASISRSLVLRRLEGH